MKQSKNVQKNVINDTLDFGINIIKAIRFH